MDEKVEILDCIFADEQELYLAYMPFIKGGGLFIRTERDFKLGSEISLSVQLPDDPANYLVSGKIVWLTPKNAQGNRPSGFGIQLLDKSGQTICAKIETLLADKLKSAQRTNTI